MAELVDARDLKSRALGRAGSIPAGATKSTSKTFQTRPDILIQERISGLFCADLFREREIAVGREVIAIYHTQRVTSGKSLGATQFAHDADFESGICKTGCIRTITEAIFMVSEIRAIDVPYILLNSLDRDFTRTRADTIMAGSKDIEALQTVNTPLNYGEDVAVRFSAAWFVWFGSCLLVSLGLANSTLASPPVEAYAALPTGSNVRISPDGSMIAMISPINGQMAITVWPVDQKRGPTVISTNKFIPRWLMWKSNKRLICSLRWTHGTSSFGSISESRLIGVDADSRNMTNLFQPPSDPSRREQFEDHLVSSLPEDPDHILLSADGGVIKVDVNTGRSDSIQKPRLLTIKWMTDLSGTIRLRQSAEESNTGRSADTTISAKTADGGRWEDIFTRDLNRGVVFDPVALSAAEPDTLYVLSNHNSEHIALYEFDIRSKSFGRLIAADPVYDIDSIVERDVLVGYQKAGLSYHTTYIDEGWASDQELLRRVFPGARIGIVDRTADGKFVVADVSRGNGPLSYWLMDKSSSKIQLTSIIETYDGVKPDDVALAKTVEYKARDGLTIPAIITLPVGYKSGPIPFVVLPHGGPSAHDDTGFDWLAQFIVSRGYGVLQPQFRGSTGFGKSFEKAGWQQWGLAMQDDVTDGTKMLIDRDLADPNRICIVGWSYGGYASLMGAIKEPGLYRCSAAVAAVTDLVRLVDNLAYYRFGDTNIPLIGDSRSQLHETSPAENAGRIKAPVLLIHGNDDFTVPVVHTEVMERALKSAGKEVEAIYLPGADHYASRQSDRVTILKALERFLRLNLGPVAQAH